MYFIRLRALVFLEYPSTILAEDLGSQYTGNTVVSSYNFNFLAGWEKLTIWNVKIGSNSNIKYLPVCINRVLYIKKVSGTGTASPLIITHFLQSSV